MKYPVIIAPTHVPEMNAIAVTPTHVEVGSAVTLTRMMAAFKEQIAARPATETGTLRAVVNQLRWFAGCQIRNGGLPHREQHCRVGGTVPPGWDVWVAIPGAALLDGEQDRQVGMCGLTSWEQHCRIRTGGLPGQFQWFARLRTSGRSEIGPG